jgi:hypothetical protein
MAKVVMIHGIAQEQMAADVLEEVWLPALAGGVRTAGFSRIADLLWRDKHSANVIDGRMAFYGHLFLQQDQQGGDVEELSFAEKKIADDLALRWLERAAVRAVNPKDQAVAARELAYVAGEPVEDEQGLRSGIREVVKSLAKLRWFGTVGMALAERFVNKSLVQVTKYLTDDSLRSAVQSIVSELVDSDTKIIIGHSLGSVIAYEAAQELKHQLPLLVTLGSPLGLDTVVYPRLRPQPPGFPQQVQRWINVADRNDFVAAEPDLTGFFNWVASTCQVRGSLHRRKWSRTAFGGVLSD